jgi:hypothetical protein
VPVAVTLRLAGGEDVERITALARKPKIRETHRVHRARRVRDHPRSQAGRLSRSRAVALAS